MKLYTRLLCFALLSSAIGVNAQSFTAQGAILNPSGNAGVPMVLDMNGDGLDDVVRATSGNLVIDYQQADGTFSQTVIPAGITNYASWSACAGDLNNDGYMDFLFGSGSRGSFLNSSNDGTVYTETVLPDYLFSQRTNIVDIDNDGDLDGFACHDVDESHPYRNDGNGNMVEDQSLIQTVPLAGNYASVWVDFDNDGDTDMHMSKCRQGSSPGDTERENAMYRNNGDGTFTEVAAEVGLFDADQSWVTIFQDFDNDGDFDTYTVNHNNQNFFRVNDGSGNYTVFNAVGLDYNDLNSWAAVGADFDNDGWIDILVESQVGKQMYRNNGDLTFTPMSMPFDDGALGDLNNDGFLDVFTGNNVFINDGNDNNYIKFSLQGLTSNAQGIGSRVTIYGDFGMQMRECRSGENFRPMSTLALHFGLGQSTAVDSVVVDWPSGISTTVVQPAVNALNTLPEASCLFTSSQIQVEGSTQICPGESVTLTAPEGFDYDWSTDESAQTITVSESGTYSLVMENEDGCLALPTPVTIEVVQDVAPTIDVTGDIVFCSGESITLTSSEALSYSWSTGDDTQSITVDEAGSYSVVVEGLCQETASEAIEVSVIEAGEPAFSSATLDDLAQNVTYTAEGENIAWYEDEAMTAEIGLGASITLPWNDGDADAYAVERAIENSALQNGGKLDDAGNGGTPSTGAFSYFDAFEPFILERTTVYVVNDIFGQRTITLNDAGGNVLLSTTVNLQSNGAHTIELNWEVPAGSDLSLRCPENNLFRNNSGVSYPYPIGEELGELTTTDFGGSYYYYFYDWKVRAMPVVCSSEPLLFSSTLLSTDEITELSGLDVYPNPTTGQLTLDLDVAEASTIQIRLVDALGAEVLAPISTGFAIGQSSLEMNLSGLANGIYQLRISTPSGETSRRVIKQ